MTAQTDLQHTLRSTKLTINPTQFNYPIDIRGKWHGTSYGWTIGFCGA